MPVTTPRRPHPVDSFSREGRNSSHASVEFRSFGVHMIPLSFFLCSLLFLLWVSRRANIEAISLYWVFASFQCLYNLIPWITLQLNLPAMQLLSDRHVVDTQLILSAISDISFGCIFLAFYKNTPLTISRPRPLPSQQRNFALLTLPLFLLTCVLCAKFGWNQFATGAQTGSPGGMFTVTAYVKHIMVGVFLYYLYRFGIDRWGWILFAENGIVMFIDGARTTFLPVAVITCMVYAAQLDRAKRKKVYVLALVGLLASVGARSIILSKQAGFIENLMAPVAVEGSMGAYPSLQAIYAVQHHANNGYTYGASYLVDPLVELLPKGDLRDKGQSLTNWEHGIDLGIPDKFAPMGGFYYQAEAVAAFWYFGPLLITSLYAASLVWMERTKNRHLLFYLVWAGTIGVLFVKINFANTFKIFLTQFLVAKGLWAVHNYRIFMGRKTTDPKSSGVTSLA